MENEPHLYAIKAAAARQNVKERQYWLDKLSGELANYRFPSDSEIHTDGPSTDGTSDRDRLGFKMAGALFSRLLQVGNRDDRVLHVVLTAGLNLLMYRYTGSRDIVVGTPIYSQDRQGEFINTAIPLRSRLLPGMTFRELLVQVRQTVREAVEHQDYPIEILAEQLQLPVAGDGFPLFDVGILLKNIQEKKYIEHLPLEMTFSFDRSGDGEAPGGFITGEIEFVTGVYERETVERIGNHFIHLLRGALESLDSDMARLEMLSPEERRLLLEEFNFNRREYPPAKTIHRRFQEQAARTPANIAAEFVDGTLTYAQLDRNAQQVAEVLTRYGVTRGSVVGIMLEPSLQTAAALLGILMAGGAYLPIDPGMPEERILYMLEDAAAAVLLAAASELKEFSFTRLGQLESGRLFQVRRTEPRAPIMEFDRLPVPDRSLIDLRKYKGRIGMASAVDCISIQATRGCPYRCVFCHKVWSKQHVFRSAENIFSEIEHFYKLGVRNFAVIDDVFNLDPDNSRRLFRLIRENQLDLQLFFPNGLRGDMLTVDYIDLMVEAGTRGINLSLETASPRLQKLIRKNLDIERFKQNIDYIAREHPEVILELAVMHGFPTETEAEALMTLEFIKGIKWLHFPYIHILKIYPNTEMEALALANGISPRDIRRSADLAYHELPATLPFSVSFSRKFQADFMRDYFLLKERLRRVLPVQLKVLGDAAVLEKYNAYLPVEVKRLADILTFAGIDDAGLPDVQQLRQESAAFELEPEFRQFQKGAKRILFLDITNPFSDRQMLYRVVEQPLGLISLLTYLKKEFGPKIDGRIVKAGVDFDSCGELGEVLGDYDPDLVGIRALTFNREFFHQVVSLVRQWGVTVPVVAGGPYATSDAEAMLQDVNIDLAVVGEGEHTMADLIGRMLGHGFKIPGREILQCIPGIAYRIEAVDNNRGRVVVLLDEIAAAPEPVETGGLFSEAAAADPAYVMYTSGSTGRPKGVMVEHNQVSNCLDWMQEKFQLEQGQAVVQRTNLTFDPSVWEIFWPLQVGAVLYILDTYRRKDAGFLIDLMARENGPAVMYCPATLVTVMTRLLKEQPSPPCLLMPWLIIGAEPVAAGIVRDFYHYYRGQVVNTYGPTEGTINNTYLDLERREQRSPVPIGRPVANNQIYILSPDLQLLPLKIPGEIWIGGESLARGYLNRMDITSDCFRDNPFDRGRIYRSGDIGRWLPDGSVEILGRRDDQVKIRGHRIEVGEIDALLRRHPAVNDCLVMVRGPEADTVKEHSCKQCGITDNYPGVKIDEDGLCNICDNISRYQAYLDEYFTTLEGLKKTIIEANYQHDGPYDCLLLYAGGRGAAFALYRLVKMGFRVLALTYDHGYFGKRDLENIKDVTAGLGVDHHVLCHENSGQILEEGIKVAATPCRGCFHASAALAAEYACLNNIRVVIGATLSRGQIIENKLFMFWQQGITETAALEREVLNIQKNAPDIDRSIFDAIAIDVIRDRSVYDKVKFLDFYRYCDITNREMIAFLNSRDSRWRGLKESAVYSTNCPLKQIGDFGHLKEKGYHYYGGATYWERRLGHITAEDIKADLACRVTLKGYRNFLRRLGMKEVESGRSDDRSLCAYVVVEGEVSRAELKDFLSERLPDYMIPQFWVPIDALPLMPNGKIDRRALPPPENNPIQRGDYRPPDTETERRLTEVWQGVLGIDRIGIQDNFFDLGGDSIKAIQIAARLQQHGLKLEIRDMFLNPTIHLLSRCVINSESQPDQGTVEGMVELTPIQRWFFEYHHQLHHFNQSVLLYHEGGFETDDVKRAVMQLTVHHDALRMVFKRRGSEMIQMNRGVSSPEEMFRMSVFRLGDDADIRDEIEKQGSRLQQGFDLEHGPLIQLGQFQSGWGDYLLIIIHHLVLDAVSWRIILADLAMGLKLARQGEKVEYPPKSDSFQLWARQLKDYSLGDEVLDELDYWRVIEETVPDPLPVRSPGEAVKRLRSENGTVSLELTPEQTGKLLKEVNRAYHTEVNDILLTALAVSLWRWSGMERAAVSLEGHGREAVVPGININRTVGWFTCRFPVILTWGSDNLSNIQDPHWLGRWIKRVKEILRGVPNRGIGYGILRYLTPPDRREELSFRLEPEISFNYLGQFGDESHSAPDIFTVSDLARGTDVSPEAETIFKLDINAMTAADRLIVSFGFNVKDFERRQMETLACRFRESLLEIIDFCIAREESEMTISDYDADDLNEAEVEAVYEELEID